jgi:predicted lipoprotein
MSRFRIAATVVFGLRIAYGAGLLAAPDKVTKRWLGPARTSAAATVALRGLGAREVALHGAGLLAVLHGAPLRPWLAASIAGDISDIAATAVSRHDLPGGAAPATAAVAGGSAALSAALLAAAAE